MANITGTSGNDSLVGTSSADTITGAAGNDTLVGGLGSDTLYGGDGTDVIYTGNASGVVTGSTTDNVYAGIGNDLIYVTEIGGGAATIDGGAGIDTVFFEFDPSTLGGTTLRIVMSDTTTQPLDGITGDQFFLNIENVTTGAGTDSVVGNSSDNIITSAGGSDTINGGVGNDTLYGGAGADSVLGGTGNDALYGGSENDTLIGGAGADVIDGGTGTDLSDYSGSSAGVTVSLATGLGSGGDAAGDTLTGIENLTGSAFNDSLTGATGANLLNGGAGNDSIAGGAGADSLIGGTGTDTLEYLASGAGVSVNLATNVVSGGDAAGDVVSQFENVTGSAFNDSLTGDTGANVLDGGAGNDTVDGGTGNDVLFGGSGNDQLSGGLGDDTLYGGVGDDYFAAETGNDALYGGDGADTFAGGLDQTVDGGTGNDLLDLSSWGWSLTNIIYDPLNQQNGTVQFLDTSGNIIGSMTFTNIEKALPCFTPGTQIMTDRGEVAVEDLRPGDLVETLDHGPQPLCWVGSRNLSIADLIVQPMLRPVRIKAGALGNSLPTRDMMVSPQHRLLLQGARAEMLFCEAEVLVAATHLTELTDVEQVLPYGVTYIHLLFDRHELIQADGAWTESFQPADRTLSSMDDDQRSEIEALFPELLDGKISFPAARLTLKSYEARVLLAIRKLCQTPGCVASHELTEVD